ncbi:hypothetical protein BDV11DRAFT_183227 [Aspergillus similis]
MRSRAEARYLASKLVGRGNPSRIEVVALRLPSACYYTKSGLAPHRLRPRRCGRALPAPVGSKTVDGCRLDGTNVKQSRRADWQLSPSFRLANGGVRQYTPCELDGKPVSSRSWDSPLCYVWGIRGDWRPGISISTPPLLTGLWMERIGC